MFIDSISKHFLSFSIETQKVEFKKKFEIDEIEFCLKIVCIARKEIALALLISVLHL